MPPQRESATMLVSNSWRITGAPPQPGVGQVWPHPMILVAWPTAVAGAIAIGVWAAVAAEAKATLASLTRTSPVSGCCGPWNGPHRDPLKNAGLVSSVGSPRFPVGRALDSGSAIPGGAGRASPGATAAGSALAGSS